jgi:glycosyltransferase involved in cell wall biosynthesis
MEPLVSIIVPIYKVEKYIRRCVESILNQSYKSIEIILVDDGSPDNCGRIIDTYEDSRIIVLHKENGGLSDARNFGMKHITGEYIFFLDSDDWIDVDAIKSLVNIIKKYKADIVQCGFYYAYDKYLLYDNRYYNEEDNLVLLDNESLMRELIINEKVKNFAWGKLYKAELVKEQFFRKGVIFEDIFWTHLIMSNVDKYVICHKALYYYAQRKDSIVSTYSIRNLDMLMGLKERHIYIENYYSKFIKESYIAILKASIMHYELLNKNKTKDKDFFYRKEIKDYILNNIIEIRNAVEADKELTRKLILFKNSYYLYKGYILTNKILKRLKLKVAEPALKRIDLK